MRTRGWIVLLSSLPIWTYIIFGSRQYEQSKHIGGNWYAEDIPISMLLAGAHWALLFLTPVALGLLLFDSFSWLRRRHDRNHQAN